MEEGEEREESAIPKPPSLAGSAIKFLSLFLGGGRPMRLGVRFVLIVPSHACGWWPIVGVVRDKKKHLLVIRWVKGTSREVGMRVKGSNI